MGLNSSSFVRQVKNNIMKNFLLLTIALAVVACQPQPKMDDSVKSADLYDYDVETRIKELGMQLKEPSPPVANYVNAVRTGDLVFMAGKGPTRSDGSRITGKVGEDLSVEEGYEASKLVAEAQLAALKAEIGDLNKVVKIVKVVGMVNCTSDFENQPEVINGFSDTMVKVFGERGKHARAAVGMGSLPRNITVEIEMIVEVQD